MQPVYAGDVADAVLGAPKVSDSGGKTYELGGPEICTYRELIERILTHAGRRRFLLPVPFRLWELLAILCRPLAAPPVTKAQVTLMRADNVVANDALALADLGVAPTALKTVLPAYRFCADFATASGACPPIQEPAFAERNRRRSQCRRSRPLCGVKRQRSRALRNGLCFWLREGAACARRGPSD